MSKSENLAIVPPTSDTALAPIVSALSLPDEHTVERARYAQAAGDMVQVLAMHATNPNAVVRWHGKARSVASLVKAWNKLALEAERKRLDTAE